MTNKGVATEPVRELWQRKNSYEAVVVERVGPSITGYAQLDFRKMTKGFNIDALDLVRDEDETMQELRSRQDAFLSIPDFSRMLSRNEANRFLYAIIHECVIPRSGPDFGDDAVPNYLYSRIDSEALDKWLKSKELSLKCERPHGGRFEVTLWSVGPFGGYVDEVGRGSGATFHEALGWAILDYADVEVPPADEKQ